MNVYSDCGQKWSYKYVHRLPEKSAINLKIGTANHAILEGINRWIRDKKTEPDINYFDIGTKELITSSIPGEMILELRRAEEDLKKPADQYIDETRATIISQIQKFARIYIEKAKDLFKEIVLIEKEHTFVANNVPFKLVTDVVVRYKDGSLRVLDFKTKGKALNEVAILQLVAYGIGIEDLLKEKVGGLEQWDFIKVKNPYLNIHTVDIRRYEGYKKVFLEEVASFWKGVHAGHFIRNLKSTYCGPGKCSFWNICMNTDEEDPNKKEIAEFHSDVVSNLSARRSR